MSSVYEVINPATEKAVTQVALADVAEAIGYAVFITKHYSIDSSS